MIIAVLHFVALYFHLYWSLWWFDIVMHFLGGAWVAAFTLWYLSHSLQSTYGKMKGAGVIVLATLCVGILWEVYEYFFGISLVGKDAYIVDTTLDIIMDLTGALTASALFISRTPASP
ncbi:MAG: hypothetical protein G01um101448_1100 [Parcubacteria group bacterium Gr01-1014_48]|nr:MAG: hypothetical protein G01um101448_1100 [Parcubacteria group bacterium Gr01-1014_48]